MGKVRSMANVPAEVPLETIPEEQPSPLLKSVVVLKKKSSKNIIVKL